MALQLPIGRIAAAAAVVAGAIVLTRSTHEPRFRSVADGVEFAILHGEPYCRQGSPQVAVLRLDPTRVRVRVRHFTLEPERQPLDIVRWRARSGAVAVFNAGQYYPDLSYMGLLVSGGRVVSPRLHPTYKAALVADAEGEPRGAGVIDLQKHPLDPARPGWREVAQSFMLFDDGGAPRIRRTGQIAARTVVAEDRGHRLLVITSEGGYTLWEFARLLRGWPLGITHAMSMDGGGEAQLCVRGRSFRYGSFGSWDESSPDDGTRVPLPAVVTVETR